jgi:hypothetical protein
MATPHCGLPALFQPYVGNARNEAVVVRVGRGGGCHLPANSYCTMGDHFNLLIRPVLWRELKVGSRIVSHRFTMGDWKPDKTVSVVSEQGGIFELHLWAITEDIKRQLASR